jgi:hypothetical protein
MANKYKGEFTFEVGGKTYTGRYGMNALVEIEELFGKPVEAVFADLARDKSMKTARGLIWAALVQYHPDLTQAAVGDLIDEAGLDKLEAIMAAGIKAAFPDAGKAEDGADATGRPPKGATGRP